MDTVGIPQIDGFEIADIKIQYKPCKNESPKIKANAKKRMVSVGTQTCTCSCT